MQAEGQPGQLEVESLQGALSDFETFIQYGDTGSEQMRLRSLLRKHNRAADPDFTTMVLAYSLPYLIADWIFAVAWMISPHFVLTVAAHLFPHISGNGQTLADSIRVAWDMGVWLLGIYGVVLAYSIQMKRTVFWEPTHLAVGCTGIRFVNNWYLTSFAPKPIAWSQIKSIVVRKRKNKVGQQIKVIEIKSNGRRTLRIDLRRFLREQDREYLGRVIKLWLPELSRDLDVQDIMHLDSYQPSYTRLWEQSLLTPPSRERRALLECGMELNDGQFRIIDRVGSGGQGTAYLADARIEDAFAERLSQVVLKEYVLPDLEKMHDRHRALKKLEKEVSLLGRLSHPGIAAFVDVFVEDHRAYVVSEFVDGPSLRQKVEADGPLPELKVIMLAMEMCDVLTYLHGLDPIVVHQDFTPENLILSSSGSVKLIDFNVARESISIKTGLVVGKQSYMPPEQYKGKANAQSDVFALGCTMHFLLTGIDPEPLTVSRPLSLRAEVPAMLNACVEKATALDVDQRYQSAAELKTDLLGLLAEFVCQQDGTTAHASDATDDAAHVVHSIKTARSEAEEVII